MVESVKMDEETKACLTILAFLVGVLTQAEFDWVGKLISLFKHKR